MALLPRHLHDSLTLATAESHSATVGHQAGAFPGTGPGRCGLAGQVRGLSVHTHTVHMGGDGSLAAASAAVDLYWLPLGAGGHFVRLNGRVYEALTAAVRRRPARDLYHSALRVQIEKRTYVIEQAPVRDRSGSKRGVVAEGAVGSPWAGRFRIFRYEVRRWLDGEIPDIGEAVDSPQRLTEDERSAQRVLALVAHVPTPVWGRDELATGEMWNSNSVISWVVARSGIDVDAVAPPAGGRAPGWHAGLVVARRQLERDPGDEGSAGVGPDRVDPAC